MKLFIILSLSLISIIICASIICDAASLRLDSDDADIWFGKNKDTGITRTAINELTMANSGAFVVGQLNVTTDAIINGTSFAALNTKIAALENPPTAQPENIHASVSLSIGGGTNVKSTFDLPSPGVRYNQIADDFTPPYTASGSGVCVRHGSVVKYSYLVMACTGTTKDVAYVMQWQVNQWKMIFEFPTSDIPQSSEYGIVMAISDNAETIVMHSNVAGITDIWTRGTTPETINKWTNYQQLDSSHTTTLPGHNVALSGDGKFLCIANHGMGPGVGRGQVFIRNIFTAEEQLLTTGTFDQERLGKKCHVNTDGTMLSFVSSRAITSSKERGKLFTYKRTTGTTNTWTLLASQPGLPPDDPTQPNWAGRFDGLTMSGDHRVAFVGVSWAPVAWTLAPRWSGYILIYVWNGSAWTWNNIFIRSKTPTYQLGFGYSVTSNHDGSEFFVYDRGDDSVKTMEWFSSDSSPPAVGAVWTRQSTSTIIPFLNDYPSFQFHLLAQDFKSIIVGEGKDGSNQAIYRTYGTGAHDSEFRFFTANGPQTDRSSLISSQNKKIRTCVGNGDTCYDMSLTSFHPTIDDRQSLGTSTNRWTTLWVKSGTISTSDRRSKSHITPLSSQWSLKFIKKLSPVHFQWIHDDTTNNNNGNNNNNNNNNNSHFQSSQQQQYGFIAQDIYTVLKDMNMDPALFSPLTIPPTISNNNNNNNNNNNIDCMNTVDLTVDELQSCTKGRFGIQYSQLISILTSAIQQQQLLISALENQVDKLFRQQQNTDLILQKILHIVDDN